MRRRILAASLVALLGIVGIFVLLRCADDPPPGSPVRDLAAGDPEVGPRDSAPEEIEPPTPELATSVPSVPGSVAEPEDTPPRSASPEHPPAPAPFSELPGLRFEAHFTDWRAPYIPGAHSWRIVGFRESLTGCRRVGPYLLGRGIGPMVYRVDLGQGLGLPPIGDGKISLAVFLLAVPIDAERKPIGGHLVAHSAEAHLGPRDLERDPRAFLRSRARTIDFSVELAEAPAGAVARGWFEHAAIDSRWPAADVPLRVPMGFPAVPEMFANDAGWLRFAGARLDAPLSEHGRLDVVGWPMGMHWPRTLEVRGTYDSPGIWSLTDPDSILDPEVPSRAGFEPRPVTLHRYRRLSEFLMPPIEVVGGRRLAESLEDGVVLVQTAGLSAEARVVPETGLWRWSVTHAHRGESQAFQAVLVLSGASPTVALGRTNSDRPLIFRLRSPEGGAVLGENLIVAPGLRLDIPIAYELVLRHRGSAWNAAGVGLARDGFFILGNLARDWESELVVEPDTIEWARMLETAYQERWGRALLPLEVHAEVVGESTNGATVLEVVVEHGGDAWPLAEFLEEFGIPP